MKKVWLFAGMFVSLFAVGTYRNIHQNDMKEHALAADLVEFQPFSTQAEVDGALAHLRGVVRLYENSKCAAGEKISPVSLILCLEERDRSILTARTDLSRATRQAQRQGFVIKQE